MNTNWTISRYEYLKTVDFKYQLYKSCVIHHYAFYTECFYMIGTYVISIYSYRKLFFMYNSTCRVQNIKSVNSYLPLATITAGYTPL